MDWPGRMMRAIDYIEDNLADDISLAEAARIACCSSFYFQRLFAIVTGMTVAEYIRRRRLTLAAVELASGEARVIDVALKYGYDSPDSFTRASGPCTALLPWRRASGGYRWWRVRASPFKSNLKEARTWNTESLKSRLSLLP